MLDARYYTEGATNCPDESKPERETLFAGLFKVVFQHAALQAARQPVNRGLRG
jgi:hypothetical protein